MAQYRLRERYDNAGNVEASQVDLADLGAFFDWCDDVGFSGGIHCEHGDWVVKQNGQFVVCDHELFNQLYTPAEVEV